MGNFAHTFLSVRTQHREVRLVLRHELIESGAPPTKFSLALQPPWALASDFQFHDHFTDGRTPLTGDQPVAMPLPKHRTTQI
jgi:hypothetical protein